MRLLWPLLALLPVLAPAQARMRAERGGRYRLILDGRRTPLVVGTSENRIGPPSVEISRRSGRFVSGTVSHAESGAYTVTESIAFVKDGDRFFTRSGYEARGPLLLPVNSGPWTIPSHALLYGKGKFEDLGLTERAERQRDGSVKGFFYALPNGKPAEGILTELSDPVYRQWFEWRNGKRTLLGRRLREAGES